MLPSGIVSQISIWIQKLKTRSWGDCFLYGTNKCFDGKVGEGLQYTYDLNEMEKNTSDILKARI